MAAKTGTYTLIANQTVSGSSTASIVFSSIPQTYTDLVLIADAITTKATEDYAYLYFNSDTAANYSRTEMSGTGSVAQSSRFSNLIPFTLHPTNRANQIVNIMDYSNIVTYKTTVYRNNPTWSLVDAGIGLWRNTAAINTLTITGYTANIAVGSNFRLYGIEAGNQ